MKKFLAKVLQGLAVAAVPIIQSVTNLDGPIGGIVSMILSGVLKAEAQTGAGQGASKAAQVVAGIEAAAPFMISTIERATGKELVDEVAFMGGIHKLNDGIVDILNSFRVLPKPATTKP